MYLLIVRFRVGCLRWAWFTICLGSARVLWGCLAVCANNGLPIGNPRGTANLARTRTNSGLVLALRCSGLDVSSAERWRGWRTRTGQGGSRQR